MYLVQANSALEILLYDSWSALRLARVLEHYIATIDVDWAVAVCDDCYANLNPGITVTVKFYAARVPRFHPRCEFSADLASACRMWRNRWRVFI